MSDGGLVSDGIGSLLAKFVRVYLKDHSIYEDTLFERIAVVDRLKKMHTSDFEEFEKRALLLNHGQY